MKKTLLLLFSVCLVISASAQKKKDKGKDKDKKDAVDYQQSDPVADTATRFTGVIKYLITTDDRSVRDSMIIAIAEDKIKITMFNPGYKEGDIFQDNFIANFTDSSFLVLDNRKMTYKKERLGTRNAGTEITLMNYRKTGTIMKLPCKEYSGEMTMKDGDSYEAAAMINNSISYVKVQDYNFMNIHPVILGYKVVLGWRTKSSDNENTYIIAYSIEKGDPSVHFDLTGYKAL